MMRFLKIALLSILSMVFLLVVFGAAFIYKVKNGFPIFYETQAPAISFPANRPAVLFFSKTTGYRHTASIDASKPVVAALAKKNNWFLYETEDGGVFNVEQLAKFSTVIFNNSTGEVINDQQKRALEKYVENGGSLIGIHGSGDNSHHWNWYVQNLLGAEFSHHPLSPQLQTTDVLADSQADTVITTGIAQRWSHTDEWYVFFENPRQKAFNVLYTINGQSIKPSGNIPILVDAKNFGMGKDHPVAWCRRVGKGKTFYTSMGHNELVWQNENFIKLIENAIKWTQYE